MRIRHERPQAELEFSVTAPLKLTLPDGRVQTISQWSLKGFHLSNVPDIAPSQGTLSLCFQGVDIAFPVTFERAAKAEGHFLWTNLTVRQRETLNVFYKNILSGRMVSTDEMITSLDTPVDLVPMHETEEEVAADPRAARPRVLRVFWNVFAYVLVAAFVFGVVGSNIVKRLSSVPIQHARVTSETIPLTANADVFVDTVHVAPGDFVTRGTRVATVSRPEDKAGLDELRRELRRSAALIEAAQSDLARHLAARRAALSVLEANVISAEARLQAEKGSPVLRASAVTAWNALSAFLAGNIAAPGDYADITQTLQRRLQSYEDEHARLKRALAVQKDKSAARHIVATQDGWIEELTVFADQFLVRGTPVATVETTAPRQLRGWVSEQRAQALYPGQTVEVRLSNGGVSRSYQGQIATIQGGIDEAVTREFGAIVDVTVPSLKEEEARSIFTPGAPLALRAKRTMPWDGWF